MTTLSASWAPKTVSLLRIVAALLYLSHGTSKLFNVPAIMPNGATVPLASIYGLAAIIEIGCGLLLVVGLSTRLAAFIACGEMAAAYLIGHARGGFWPTVNHGEPAVLFCFIWLCIWGAGPGDWSIDAMRGRSSGSA